MSSLLERFEEEIKQKPACVPPLVTPLKKEGNKLVVDTKSLEKLVEHLINGGVDALFVMGETGEFRYFTENYNYFTKDQGLEQQRIAIKTVVKKAKELNKKIPVFANVTQANEEATKEQIEYMNRVQYKPDALILEPLYYRSNRGLPQHLLEIVSLTDLPFILYNNLGNLPLPPLKRRNIRTSILKRIANENPKIIGLKNSSGGLKRTREYIKAVRKRKDFFIFEGNEGNIYRSLKAGAAGYVPSMANIYPELLVAMSKEKDEKTLKGLQEHIEKIRHVYIKEGSIPAVLKLLLSDLDICQHYYFGEEEFPYARARELAEKVKEVAARRFVKYLPG